MLLSGEKEEGVGDKRRGKSTWEATEGIELRRVMGWIMTLKKGHELDLQRRWRELDTFRTHLRAQF